MNDLQNRFKVGDLVFASNFCAIYQIIECSNINAHIWYKAMLIVSLSPVSFNKVPIGTVHSILDHNFCPCPMEQFEKYVKHLNQQLLLINFR